MPNNINSLTLPLQKVIHLGEIDRWLRGIAKIVPRPSLKKKPAPAEKPGISTVMQDFNRHITAFRARGLVGDRDVEKMVGFRQLINAASKNNVRVDISSPGQAALEVHFEPRESFSQSRVFGASYTNILPALFGGKNGPARGK
jgi:hypothetical protein